MKLTFSAWLLTATLLTGSSAWAEDTLLAQANQEHPPASTAPAASSNEADAGHHHTPDVPSSGTLTLQQAIDKAIGNAPRLKSAEAALGASRGERMQADALPNPEIGLEAENFTGSGPYSGFDSSEVTLGVSQTIELGGKRGSRQAAAEQGLRLRGFDYEAERLDLIRDVTIAYAEAVAAQEELKLAAEQKELAADLLKEVNERVGAAREPLIQRSKAEITASTSAFAHERAEREFTHAQHTLASLWGGHHETFALDRESLFALTPPKTEAEVETALDANPNLKRWEAEKARSSALLELEKAQSIPDPRISVGVRDFRGTGDQALMAGISIPIPVFNRNQGNIEKARHEVVKAESDAAATKLTARNSAFQAHEDMINAYRQADILKSSILPAAEKAFRLAREGYRAGKFAYLEVLDSQRTLFETRAQYIAALRDYHKARAETERLTAAHETKNETQGEADAH